MTAHGSTGSPDGRTSSGPADGATPGQADGHAVREDWFAVLAFAAYTDRPNASEAFAAWRHLSVAKRVNWRAAVDAVRMATGAAREPHAAATLAAEWRQGRSQPRNVYARTGGDDWKADQLIGHFDTAGLAADACRAHNAERETGAADGVLTAEVARSEFREWIDGQSWPMISGPEVYTCDEMAEAYEAGFARSDALRAAYAPQPAPGPADALADRRELSHLNAWQGAELGRLRDGVTALAEDLEHSAAATAPSKKSAIEETVAQRLRVLLGPPAATVAVDRHLL